MTTKKHIGKRGSASTEYVLISIAILMATATIAIGTKQTCVVFKNDSTGDPNIQCENVMDNISNALTVNLSTTTQLLQLPF